MELYYFTAFVKNGQLDRAVPGGDVKRFRVCDGVCDSTWEALFVHVSTGGGSKSLASMWSEE